MDTYSLFPSTANDELQLLGSKVGNFDIMCQLEGTNSDEKWWPRWCISNDSRMKGILYFGIQFETPRNVPMEYAKVRINFGPPVSEAPIPVVDDYAPKEPVVGPPMVHQRGKNKVIAPKLGLNVGPGGGNVEGGSRETTDTSQPVRTWEFTSRRPSPSNNSSSTMSSEVEFGWERGWHDDYDGRNRRFRAAVAVSRKSTETLSMSVHVEAKPLRLWHKIRTRSAPRYKPSDLLRPVHTTSESDFRILRQDLEQKVQQDNEAKPTVTRSIQAIAAQQDATSTQSTANALGTSPLAALGGGGIIFVPISAIQPAPNSGNTLALAQTSGNMAEL